MHISAVLYACYTLWVLYVKSAYLEGGWFVCKKKNAVLATFTAVWHFFLIISYYSINIWKSSGCFFKKKQWKPCLEAKAPHFYSSKKDVIFIYGIFLLYPSSFFGKKNSLSETVAIFLPHVKYWNWVTSCGPVNRRFHDLHASFRPEEKKYSFIQHTINLFQLLPENVVIPSCLDGL